MVGLGHSGGKIREIAEGMADGEVHAWTSIQVGIDMNGACKQVEFNFIAIFHHGNRAANGRFRAAMHAHGTPGDAGDTGV